MISYDSLHSKSSSVVTKLWNVVGRNDCSLFQLYRVLNKDYIEGLTFYQPVELKDGVIAIQERESLASGQLQRRSLLYSQRS